MASTTQPQTKTPKAEKARLFTADIYVEKNLVSSVTLKAASQAAAQIACFRLIKVKVK